MKLEQAQSVTELLQALVRIPSVNPDGVTDATVTGELRIAQELGTFLESLGAEVHFDEVLPNRPNVIGRFRSEASTRVALAPHTDTVSVLNMTVDPFGGEVTDGCLYGRGSSDTKGTMAAMLWALKQLGPEAFTLGSEITFVGLMSEETGQDGSRDFAKRYGSEIDFALVGEPTDCEVVHTHKGCSWVQLETHGKAVHGSIPETGENAIMKMVKVLLALDGDFRQLLTSYSHPVLGGSSLNIGRCQGGARANIVPDHCVVTLDIRSTPALAEAGVRQVLEKFLQENKLEANIVGDPYENLPLNTSADNPYVKKLRGLGATCVGATWFCDAAHLAAGGIPSVAAGPGKIEQAHTCDEFIEIADLEKGVDFYTRFLKSL